MILDTNVVLRLIDGAEHEQHAQVRRRLEQAAAEPDPERLFVTVATVHEVVFVLSSPRTGYGFTRAEVAGEILALIEGRELEVESAGVVREAGINYGASRGIDFHDHYLAALGRSLNDEAVYSIDKDFRKL